MIKVMLPNGYTLAFVKNYHTNWKEKLGLLDYEGGVGKRMQPMNGNNSLCVLLCHDITNNL